MFQHIGALSLAPEATAEQREALAESFRGLEGVVPGLVRARAAVDPGLQATNCSVLFVLDFETEQAWRDYSSHPAHDVLVDAHLSNGRLVNKLFMQVPDGTIL